MKNRPRILFAGLYHETHTFLEGVTGWNDFTVLRGDQMLAARGDSSPLGGALEAVVELNWEIVPTLNLHALPSALVADEVFANFWDEFRVAATAELTRGIDGIYLVLHGAMTCESIPDVDGEFLERLAGLPGAKGVPVFGVFDLHANFTPRMAAHANGLVGYRENPHTDARESAVRAVHLLDRALSTGQRPKMFFAHPPIVWPPTGTATNADPMKSLLRLARSLEKRNPEFWEISVVGGFAFADTPETGVSFAITTSGAGAQAEAALDELCACAIELATLGNVIEEPVAEVLRRVPREAAGLTVLAEPSDNIGGGAPGDGTGLLRALIEHDAQNAAVCLCDSGAVEHLRVLRPGERVTLALGGRGSRLDAGPCKLEVELLTLTDGRFELEDKQSHLASSSGDWFDMGLCAVVRHRGITILLTSNRTPPMDLGQWRHVGLAPEKFSLIGVKAAVAHRRAYDLIAARHYWVDTPGPCSSRLAALPYRKLHRPIYPLDPLDELKFNEFRTN
ncbi:MAG: M81 family peptidase [Pedosphaera sp.]|nr:M81 family peptidase [Pedosphaera sp.]